jgi:asparagine synthase (glutamine-hydrolysing)
VDSAPRVSSDNRRKIESGAQPLTNADESIVLAVNGEIYNHRLIRKSLKEPYHFKTASDCEVIIPLYAEYGLDAPKHLDGMFSFVLYDKKLDRTIAARDPIGITTLYQGWSSAQPGTVYFASELKSLHPVCDKIESFPPGHIFDSATGERTRYFEPSWWDGNKVPETPGDLKLLRETLEKSVRKRLMAEVPYGVLLSGGLDSSLVASIAQRETLRLRKLAEDSAVNGSGAADSASQTGDADRGEGLVGIDDENKLSTMTFLPQLNSFSIGLPGSPDNKAALEVAKFLGTKHHVMTFTIDDGLNALSDVIYHLETYDVTTIRASTPMYLLSRKIKAMGIKMVLSGEGSDEIFGGYLYFHGAPDKAAFHEECVRRVKNLHLADCLRANKSTSAWGLEARVPFLDKEVSHTHPPINSKPLHLTPPAVPRGLDEHRPQGEAHHRREAREVVPAQGLRHDRRARHRALPARQDPLAPEGAVLGRRRLRLDRRAQGPRRDARHRRDDEEPQARVGR